MCDSGFWTFRIYQDHQDQVLNMASTKAVFGDMGVAGEAPHCGHFVQRKKRFCRMFVPPGKKFCAEHSIDISDTTTLNNSGPPHLDARIPCPLDPKHNCQASKLQKHIKVVVGTFKLSTKFAAYSRYFRLVFGAFWKKTQGQNK